MFAAPTLKTIYKRKRRNILDLFSVEGEGGYLNLEYTFMFKSSAFFSDEIKPKVKSISANPLSFQTLNITGSNYTFTDNILRIVLGNNNQCILYRNGDVDIGGSRSKFLYLEKVAPFVTDIFGPSTYNDAPICFKELILLKNGDLVEINVQTKTNKTLLTNVDEFLGKNQAHRSDCLVAMKDKTLAYINTNVNPTLVSKVGGVTSDQISFTSFGDAAATYIIRKKSDPRNLYRFDTVGDWFPSSLQTTPIASMTLPVGEYYVDGVSAETYSLFITNKRIRSRSTAPTLREQADWGSGGNWDIDSTLFYNKRIITPTAYSAIIEDIHGKYWFLNGRASYTNDYPDLPFYQLAKPIPYEYFDKLKNYLEPIRAAMK